MSKAVTIWSRLLFRFSIPINSIAGIAIKKSKAMHTPYNLFNKKGDTNFASPIPVVTIWSQFIILSLTIIKETENVHSVFLFFF